MVAEVCVSKFFVVEIDGVESVVGGITCYPAEVVFKYFCDFTFFFVVEVVGILFVGYVDLYVVAYVVSDRPITMVEALTGILYTKGLIGLLEG